MYLESKSNLNPFLKTEIICKIFPSVQYMPLSVSLCTVECISTCECEWLYEFLLVGSECLRLCLIIGPHLYKEIKY